ncbi:LysR family transcriptional regulator, partial [Agromyces seonyuensis]
MIDQQGLRALVGVADHGTVVAAATALGYTPSAVSQQVKRLERDLGTPLLERHGRGVLLTERGRTVAVHARGVLDGLDRLRSDAADEALLPPLRIASFSTATRGLLPPVLRAFAERGAAGRQTATVLSVDPFDALALVERGDVDLAVVHNWDTVPLVPGEGLVSVPLLDDVADILLWDDHPLAARDELERAELVDELFSSIPRGQICRIALERFFVDLDRMPRIVAEDSDWASLVELVRARVAICLVPRLGRGPLPLGVVARPLADRSQVRRVAVVFRAARAESGAIRTAVRLLQE